MAKYAKNQILMFELFFKASTKQSLISRYKKYKQIVLFLKLIELFIFPSPGDL
jgi:hypothetical protein